jgi:hypothetical protein
LYIIGDPDKYLHFMEKNLNVMVEIWSDQLNNQGVISSPRPRNIARCSSLASEIDLAANVPSIAKRKSYYLSEGN